MGKRLTVKDLMKENSEVMKNRAFGVIVIGGKYSKFNAGFDSLPKFYNGKYVASDNAKKYASREYWDKQGLMVFDRKSYIENKGKKVLRDLSERYEYLFDSEPKTEEEVFENMLNCIDKVNYGFLFAKKQLSVNLTGAVQLNYGIDRWENNETINDQILTPYRNSKKEKNEDGEVAAQSTLGSKSFVDTNFFSYGFNVNPANYNIVKEFCPDFQGYPRVAYDKFKESALRDVTLMNSVTKVGCYNHFALFVELKDDSLSLIPNPNYLIDIEETDDENKVKIDVTRIYEQLGAIKDEIKSVEIYYNQFDTELVCEAAEDIFEKTNKFSILNPSISL